MKNRIVDYIGSKKCQDGRKPPADEQGGVEAVVLIFGIPSDGPDVSHLFRDEGKQLLLKILTMESGKVSQNRGLELGLDFTLDDCKSAIMSEVTDDLLGRMKSIWESHGCSRGLDDDVYRDMKSVIVPVAERIIDKLTLNRSK
jgi:hypothetical protein